MIVENARSKSKIVVTFILLAKNKAKELIV
jgi:hypothetical protein